MDGAPGINFYALYGTTKVVPFQNRTFTAGCQEKRVVLHKAHVQPAAATIKSKESTTIHA
jgi:hypothetical protein